MRSAKLLFAFSLFLGFAVISGIGDSIIDVGPAYGDGSTLTLVGTPNSAAVTLSTTAPTLTDAVVLSGGANPTGSITFTLYNGVNALVDTETATVSDNGTYSTPTGYTLPTTGTVTGNYQWDISYSGDGNNGSVSDNNDPSEQVTVSSASPVLAGSPSSALVNASTELAPLTDSATVSGGYYPTGSITFTLYNGVNALVDTETATVSDNGTYSTPTGYTLPTTGTVTGTYQWDISYSGDGNNGSVSDNNDLADQVTVKTDVVGLVTVSGIVDGPNGSPESGTTVTFGGSQATTGSDGSYFMYVFPNTTGGLFFYEPAGASPGFSMTAQVNNFSVTTSDVAENFSWPATGNVAVSVTDANTDPMPGITVYEDGGSNLTETLTDGTSVQVQIQGEAPWQGPNNDYCISDGNGQCNFTALVGSEPFFYANTQQIPGDLSYPLLGASAYPTWTADSGTATLQFTDLPLVTVSGIVDGPDGSPESGTTVTFGGTQATTGSDGSYVLHPPVNTTGGLFFYEPAGASPGFSMTAQVNNFSVTTSDVAENFSWPATGNVAVSVTDANTDPMPGITVYEDGGSNLTETLTDGTSVQVQIQGEAPWQGPNNDYCISDGNGQCNFTALVGSEPFFYANTQQIPGDLSYPLLGASAYPTWTADSGTATLQFTDLPLVTVSGIVDGPDGSPESGTTVTFGGTQATTGSDGSYVLHPPVNTTGGLFFYEPAGASPGFSMTAQVNNFSVTTSDVAENFSWPATGNVAVSVTDANTDPMPGITVYEDGGSNLTETLTDGTSVQVQIQGEAPWQGPNNDYCISDGNGQCNFTALVGSEPFFYANTQLVPGDLSYPLLGASAYPTWTADSGTATLQFVNLAQQESDGTVTGSLFVASPNGTTITDIANTPITLPSGAVAVTGALTYEVLTGQAPGTTIEVTLQLPPNSDPTAVFKLENGVYVDISSGSSPIATISGNEITLQLTVGANGVVVDPLIPALLETPSAPTIGQVTVGNASVSVDFTAPAEIVGNPILSYTASCQSSDGGATRSATGGASPLEVGGLTNGDTYACTVTAENAQGTSSPSASSSSFTVAVPQTISFTAPVSGLVGGSAALVATGGPSGNPVTFSIDATSGAGVCKVSGTNGATLHYTAAGQCVVDANQIGNSTYAAAATVTGSTKVGKFQAIIFGPLANKTLAQSPVKVIAISSSGLTVTFSTTTPTVCIAGGNNGASISLLKAGKCTVVASQAGNATYNPAASLSQSFTVSMASQNITFGELANKTLAQSPVSVSATASSGLTVTFSTTTPTVCIAGGNNGASISLLKAGKCTVVASQAGNATYNPASAVSQSFTVTMASQNITFGELANKKIAQSPFTVSANASSGLVVTFTTTTPAVCTAGGANGATITLLKAGKCTVVASQAGNATYNPASSVSQSFTVSK